MALAGKTPNNQFNHQLAVNKTHPILKLIVFFSFIFILFLFFRVNQLQDRISQLQGKLTQKQMRNQLQLKSQFGQEIKQIQFQMLTLQKQIQKSNALLYKEIAQLANNQRSAYAALSDGQKLQKEQNINNDQLGRQNSKFKTREESFIEMGKYKFNNFANSVKDSQTLKGFSDSLNKGSEKVRQVFSDIGGRAKRMFGGKQQTQNVQNKDL